MAEISDYKYSYLFMLENNDIIILPEVDRIHKKLQIESPRETELNWNKFTIHNFLWIRSILGKMMISYVF